MEVSLLHCTTHYAHDAKDAVNAEDVKVLLFLLASCKQLVNKVSFLALDIVTIIVHVIYTLTV